MIDLIPYLVAIVRSREAELQSKFGLSLPNAEKLLTDFFEFRRYEVTEPSRVTFSEGGTRWTIENVEIEAARLSGWLGKWIWFHPGAIQVPSLTAQDLLNYLNSLYLEAHRQVVSRLQTEQSENFIEWKQLALESWQRSVGRYEKAFASEALALAEQQRLIQIKMQLEQSLNLDE